jgi:hypothetical protein
MLAPTKAMAGAIELRTMYSNVLYCFMVCYANAQAEGADWLSRCLLLGAGNVTAN